MNNVVLDASALMALVNQEPGHSIVAKSRIAVVWIEKATSNEENLPPVALSTSNFSSY